MKKVIFFIIAATLIAGTSAFAFAPAPKKGTTTTVVNSDATSDAKTDATSDAK